MGQQGYDEEDEAKEALAEAGGVPGLKDWDCPSCNANNPSDELAKNNDEIRCNYCGTGYRVLISDEGRVRLKET